jgi:hypothetical protein
MSPPRAQADAADARLLRSLAGDVADVLFSRLGSESDFGVFPVLLQAPPPGTAAAGAAGSDDEWEDEDEDGEGAGSDGGGGGGEGAGGAAVWQTAAAREALAALRVPGMLAARLDAHQQRTFDTAEAFVR